MAKFWRILRNQLDSTIDSFLPGASSVYRGIGASGGEWSDPATKTDPARRTANMTIAAGAASPWLLIGLAAISIVPGILTGTAKHRRKKSGGSRRRRRRYSRRPRTKYRRRRRSRRGRRRR